MAVSDQSLKICSGFLGAGLGFISVHADVEPVIVILDEIAVVANLCRQRVEHGILAA